MVVLAAPWTRSHQPLLLLCLCEPLELNVELFFSCWAAPFTLFLSLFKRLSALAGGAGSVRHGVTWGLLSHTVTPPLDLEPCSELMMGF